MKTLCEGFNEQVQDFRKRCEADKEGNIFVKETKILFNYGDIDFEFRLMRVPALEKDDGTIEGEIIILSSKVFEDLGLFTTKYYLAKDDMLDDCVDFFSSYIEDVGVMAFGIDLKKMRENNFCDVDDEDEEYEEEDEVINQMVDEMLEDIKNKKSEE